MILIISIMLHTILKLVSNHQRPATGWSRFILSILKATVWVACGWFATNQEKINNNVEKTLLPPHECGESVKYYRVTTHRPDLPLPQLLTAVRPGWRRPAVLGNGLFWAGPRPHQPLGHRSRVLARSLFALIESIKTFVVPTCCLAHPVDTREALGIASPTLGNTKRKESPTWCRGGDVWAWGPLKEGTFLRVIPSEKLTSEASCLVTEVDHTDE